MTEPPKPKVVRTYVSSRAEKPAEAPLPPEPKAERRRVNRTKVRRTSVPKRRT